VKLKDVAIDLGHAVADGAGKGFEFLREMLGKNNQVVEGAISVGITLRDMWNPFNNAMKAADLAR